LPISFTHSEYVGDKLDYTAYIPKVESRWEIKDFIDFIKNPKSTVEMQNGQTIHFYPTNKIRIPVDKNNIIQNKVVAAKYNDSIVSYIDLDIKGNALYKNRLMMLDLIANNNWKRPIYFSPGAFGDEDYLWMKEYLQLDGMVYKFVPIRTKLDKERNPFDMGYIDTEKTYQLVKKWDWGNGDSPKIYHDPETRRNALTYRSNMTRLASDLISENKLDKAEEILDLGMKKMPFEYYGFYTTLDPFISNYYDLNKPKKAQDIIKKCVKKYQENLSFYYGLKASEQNQMFEDIMYEIYKYKGLIEIASEKDKAFAAQLEKDYMKYNKMFKRFTDQMED
jgi:hypothetical protein